MNWTWNKVGYAHSSKYTFLIQFGRRSQEKYKIFGNLTHVKFITIQNLEEETPVGIERLAWYYQSRFYDRLVSENWEYKFKNLCW